MNTREKLLDRLVQTLVEEWSYETVAAALAGQAGSPTGSSTGGVLTMNRRAPRKGNKPSATELVERSVLEGGHKAALLRLATRYESMQFLPSVADVREFLIMMGEKPTQMKDRKEAFRILLRSLAQLPVERLEKLATTALHSGPSQLGPLSDAIAAAGGDLPRRRQADLD
jgi:hypothetical protein